MLFYWIFTIFSPLGPTCCQLSHTRLYPKCDTDATAIPDELTLTIFQSVFAAFTHFTPVRSHPTMSEDAPSVAIAAPTVSVPQAARSNLSHHLSGRPLRSSPLYAIAKSYPGTNQYAISFRSFFATSESPNANSVVRLQAATIPISPYMNLIGLL